MSDASSGTIFGIDLGTTYSAIAYVDEFGKPTIIPNDENVMVTPSVVQFESLENVIVGRIAKEAGITDPTNCVELIKRSMGDSTFRRTLHGQEFRPEEISAYILRKLKQDAETSLGRPVNDVVITVPAYFNEAQRTATEQAGILAGFTVHGIIPEPTAAAIAYAASDADEQAILVYDLGGGTFDVTVMKVSGHKVRVVCISGDHDLGGRNWDEQIVTYLASEWQKQIGSTDDPLNSPETTQELFKLAEDNKRTLTRKQSTPVRVSHDGKNIRIELTRENFDQLTNSLLERTIVLTQSTIAEAKNNGVTRIDKILLVGGSSYMPQVQARLAAEFPGIEQQLFDPDQAVAKGAAIFASNKQIQESYDIAMEKLLGRSDLKVEDLPKHQQIELEMAVKRMLPGKSKEALHSGRQMEIINATSKNFGLIVQVAPGQLAVAYMIRRNEAVPAEKEETFYTPEPGPCDIEIQIVEAEGNEPTTDPSDTAHCRVIKTITMSIPGRTPPQHPIEVKYSLSEDGGRLRVAARDPQSGSAIDDTVETVDAIMQQDMAAMKEKIANISIL